MSAVDVEVCGGRGWLRCAWRYAVDVEVCGLRLLVCGCRHRQHQQCRTKAYRAAACIAPGLRGWGYGVFIRDACSRSAAFVINKSADGIERALCRRAGLAIRSGPWPAGTTASTVLLPAPLPVQYYCLHCRECCCDGLAIGDGLAVWTNSHAQSFSRVGLGWF